MGVNAHVKLFKFNRRYISKYKFMVFFLKNSMTSVYMHPHFTSGIKYKGKVKTHTHTQRFREVYVTMECKLLTKLITHMHFYFTQCGW